MEPHTNESELLMSARSGHLASQLVIETCVPPALDKEGNDYRPGTNPPMHIYARSQTRSLGPQTTRVGSQGWQEAIGSLSPCSTCAGQLRQVSDLPFLGQAIVVLEVRSLRL